MDERQPAHGRRSSAARRAPDLTLLVAAAFRAVADQLEARLGASGYPGMRPRHGFVFRNLGDEPLPPSELARRLGVSRQAVGKLIDEMERAGLVERHDDLVDGRKKRVALTDRGQAIHRRALAISTELESELRAVLGHARTDALIAALHQLALRLGGGDATESRRARAIV